MSLCVSPSKRAKQHSVTSKQLIRQDPPLTEPAKRTLWQNSILQHARNTTVRVPSLCPASNLKTFWGHFSAFSQNLNDSTWIDVKSYWSNNTDVWYNPNNQQNTGGLMPQVPAVHWGFCSSILRKSAGSLLLTIYGISTRETQEEEIELKIKVG